MSMAPFRTPEDAGRLDFELLRLSPVSLYFSREVLAEHVAWLREHSYAVHTFDCSDWQDEQDFHVAACRSLNFPNYYGHNLAAFKDCLCGINVSEEGGAALAFLAFDAFWRKSPETCWHILDLVAIWFRYFLLKGLRLLALVHSGDRDIHFRPVGASPVLWNRTESARYVREKWPAAREKPPPADDGAS
jgi:hypothetical protein